MHDRSGVETRNDGHVKLSPEVALLQDVFPTVSPEALMNALSASDNNVETAKQVHMHFWIREPPTLITQMSWHCTEAVVSSSISGLGL